MLDIEKIIEKLNSYPFFQYLQNIVVAEIGHHIKSIKRNTLNCTSKHEVTNIP